MVADLNHTMRALDGRIALVTGSTRGIGAGIAAEFARRGAAVAAQAGPFGIRVNCIAPETILTEGNQDRILAELRASLADEHPLKRLGTPQDLATAAAFLASEDAAWITEVVLDVAGGAVLV